MSLLSDALPVTMEFLKRPIANALMAQALQRLLERKQDEMQRICAARGITMDFRKLLSTNNVREFEELLMLPLHKLMFDNIDEYYVYNSCYTLFKVCMHASGQGYM